MEVHHIYRERWSIAKGIPGEKHKERELSPLSIELPQPDRYS